MSASNDSWLSRLDGNLRKLLFGPSPRSGQDAVKPRADGLLAYGGNAEKAIIGPGLIDFLAPMHPEEALKLLVLVFAEWAEQEYQKRQGNFDKLAASYYFLDLLIKNSSTGVAPAPGLSRKPRAMINVPYLAFKKQSREIAVQLGELSPEDAMRSLTEIILAWAYSIPKNFFEYLPFTLPDDEDKTIATQVTDWFVLYFSDYL